MSETKTLALVGPPGRRVYVEVSPSVVIAGKERGGGFSPATSADEVIEYFETLEEAIENTCATIFAGVTRVARAAVPSKITAEVSFELGGEGRIWFVAKGNAKAAVKVTAEWELGPAKPAPAAAPVTPAPASS
jgi:hypothetical protein